MNFTTIVAAIGLGYVIGRFAYDWIAGTRMISPMGEFLDELNKK